MTESTVESYLLDERNKLFVLPRGGGRIACEICRVDSQVLIQMHECALHWPEENANCAAALQDSMISHPELVHWLACETAFFVDLPQYAADYALPRTLLEKGYRRYGGDGLVHHWNTLQFDQCDNLISLHFCDHPTVAAIHAGKAVDCSQGYSAVEGLPSKNSCGTIDPSIPLLLSENGYSADEIGRIFSSQSGWGADLTLSELVSSEDPGLAVLRTHVTDAVVKAVGEAFAALGNGHTILAVVLDTPLQELKWVNRLCQRFAFAGIHAGEPVQESSGWTRYSAADSAHAVYVRSIEREAMIKEFFTKNRE